MLNRICRKIALPKCKPVVWMLIIDSAVEGCQKNGLLKRNEIVKQRRNTPKTLAQQLQRLQMAGICTAVQRRQRRATRRLGPGAATAERNEERMQRQSEAKAPVRNTQGPGTVFCFSLLHFITTVSTEKMDDICINAKTVTAGCRAGKAELCQQSDCPKAGGNRPAAEGGQPAAHKKVVEARWL